MKTQKVAERVVEDCNGGEAPLYSLAVTILPTSNQMNKTEKSVCSRVLIGLSITETGVLDLASEAMHSILIQATTVNNTHYPYLSFIIEYTLNNVIQYI